LDVLATVLEEMPPFPEKESNGILNLLKKKRPGRVPNNPGIVIYFRCSLLPWMGHQRIYLLYTKKKNSGIHNELGFGG